MEEKLCNNILYMIDLPFRVSFERSQQLIDYLYERFNMISLVIR